jgi:hypothetical protein
MKIEGEIWFQARPDYKNLPDRLQDSITIPNTG